MHRSRISYTVDVSSQYWVAKSHSSGAKKSFSSDFDPFQLWLTVVNSIKYKNVCILMGSGSVFSTDLSQYAGSIYWSSACVTLLLLNTCLQFIIHHYNLDTFAIQIFIMEIWLTKILNWLLVFTKSFSHWVLRWKFNILKNCPVWSVCCVQALNDYWLWSILYSVQYICGPSRTLKAVRLSTGNKTISKFNIAIL
jgi:hypothetical protein